ncbi:MAG: hypothetical protein EBS53_12720, partial [Bacteroidetes bacterium]|nr:hypothetical protein [Bacteroidota bacterium]
ADVGFVDDSVKRAAVDAVVEGEGHGVGLVAVAGFVAEEVVVGVAAVAGVGGIKIADDLAVDDGLGDALVVGFEHIEAVEVAFHGEQFVATDAFGDGLAEAHQRDDRPAQQRATAERSLQWGGAELVEQDHEGWEDDGGVVEADQRAGIEVKPDEEGIDAALEPPVAAEQQPSGEHFHDDDQVGGEWLQPPRHQRQAVGGGGEVAAEDPGGADFGGGGEEVAEDEGELEEELFVGGEEIEQGEEGVVVIVVAFVAVVDGHQVDFGNKQDQYGGVGGGPALGEGEKSGEHDEAKECHEKYRLGAAEGAHGEEEPIAAALEEGPAGVAAVEGLYRGGGVELPAVEGGEEAEQDGAVH